LEKYSGEWIKEQCKLTYQQYNEAMQKNTFVLNPNATSLNDKIKYYRSICPHKYENFICIYCGTPEKSTEDINNG
jgi:hypothetical protein